MRMRTRSWWKFVRGKVVGVVVVGVVGERRGMTGVKGVAGGEVWIWGRCECCWRLTCRG